MSEVLHPKHDGFKALCDVMDGPRRDRNELEYEAASEINRLRLVLTEIAKADDCWNGCSCPIELPDTKAKWCVFCLARDAVGMETPDATETA